jgi:glutathione S-transferase
MQLLFSPTSPFVRKVRVCAIEHGLEGQLTMLAVGDLPLGTVRGFNPLSKVPALVLADGSVLYDSPVICEYIDALAGGGQFPGVGPERWAALRRQALGDGLCDAALRQVMENRRDEGDRHLDELAHQAKAVTAALDVMEAEAASLTTGTLTIGEITIACALGYMDLRFAHENWRATRPRLAAWFEPISQRPSMLATKA